MSQGPMSNSPSKGGTMRSQAPTSYQSPFGDQNYRTQTSPSKGGQPSFGGPAYQQPGQFGGQIMNRPMQSPGGKGGQSRPPLEIQPYPMPSPGGKGGSYQRPPTPFGYGQPTFAPQQFAGYGQPSNIFSFNNPHYQPYNPNPIQQPYNPNTGNTGNPMTPMPEVTAQPVDQSAAMREQIKNLGQEGIQSGAVTRDMLIQAGYSNPDQILGGASGNQSAVQVEPTPQQVINPMPAGSQDRIVDPKTTFTPPGGYSPIMPFLGGKGGARTAGDEFRVFDPYGEGGAYEGQPRPTFPDPTQQQMPQGTVGGAAPVDFGQLAGQQAASLGLNDEAINRAAEQARQQFRQQSDQLRNPVQNSVFNDPMYQQLQQKYQEVGTSGGDTSAIKARLDSMMESSPDKAYYDQMKSAQPSTPQPYSGTMGSGLGSLFNLQSLMSPGQPTTGNTGLGLGSTFNSQQLAQRMQGMVGGPSPMQSPDLIARDRAAYAANRGGYNIAGQYDPNMPPGYGTTYQTLI